MKRAIYLVLCVVLVCWERAANAQFEKQANVSVQVVDQQNFPVKDAHTVVSFDLLKTSNPFDGHKFEDKMGETDKDGFWKTSSKTMGKIYANSAKAGYYKSMTNYLFRSEVQPLNAQFTLTLIQQVAPIPMYAKRLKSVVMPIADRPVGYDLMTGDWVAPYGKGVTSDLVLTLQREVRGNFDLNWHLTVHTPGDGNGLRAILPSEVNRESELHFPRTAPADGYALNAVFLGYNSSKSGIRETNSASATNFFFRVRSEYDENKHMKSALYGKFLGPIEVNLQWTKTAKLDFTYYLNPTSLDRNMEFDPKKNLFKALQVEEEVRDP